MKVAFSIRLMGRVSLVSSGKAAGECHRTFWVAPLSGLLTPKIGQNLHLRMARVAPVMLRVPYGNFRGGQDIV